jgi:threonine dehydratase
VVAASGGNHGAAVAYAAMRLGVPARIFVPTVSSPAKIRRIRGYGADLVVEGDRYADALAASLVWTARSGALPVHAFDQEETLLGQGTLARELARSPSPAERPPSPRCWAAPTSRPPGIASGSWSAEATRLR